MESTARNALVVCKKCGRMVEAWQIDTGGFCTPCHNENYWVWKEEQKRARIEYNQKYNKEALQATGLHVGDRVEYFAPAWFGIGGELITGTVVMGSGKVRIKLDHPHNGEKSAAIHKGWKIVKETGRILLTGHGPGHQITRRAARTWGRMDYTTAPDSSQGRKGINP